MPARIVNVFGGNSNLKVGDTTTPFIPIDDDVDKVTITIHRSGLKNLRKVPDTLIVYMEVSHDGGRTIIQRKRIGIEGSDINYQFGIAPFSWGNMDLIPGKNRVGRLRTLNEERFKFKIDVDYKVSA